MIRGAFFWPDVFVGSMSVMPFTVIVAGGAAAAGLMATVFLALVVLAATEVCCALVGKGNVAAKPAMARVKDKERLRVKVSSLKTGQDWEISARVSQVGCDLDREALAGWIGKRARVI